MYWWITDLIDTDAKAMGVYLTLLYLRVAKMNIPYSEKPSADIILQESKELFARYFAGRGC